MCSTKEHSFLIASFHSLHFSRFDKPRAGVYDFDARAEGTYAARTRRATIPASAREYFKTMSCGEQSLRRTYRIFAFMTFSQLERSCPE
jgi:hypothetical protein